MTVVRSQGYLLPVPVYLVVGTLSEDASALAPLIEFESKSDECRGGGGNGGGGGGVHLYRVHRNR